MPDPTEFEQFPVFGDNSSKVQPGDQKYAAGFLPGDVLPAEWLNWFLNTGTKGYNELVDAVCDPDVEGKTIDSADNTVLCTPTLISASTTLNCTKEMYVIVDTADVVLTLGTAPYDGYALSIMSVANNSCKVQYTCNGTTVTDEIWGVQPTTYIYLGSGTWRIAEGSTLRTFTGVSGVNDWKTYRGNGTYTFFYSATGSASIYNTPSSYCTVTITWGANSQASATCIQNYHSSGNESTAVNMWTCNYSDGTWSGWTQVKGGGSGTVKSITSLSTGFTGSIWWSVTNRICVLTTSITASATGSNQTVTTNAPKARMNSWASAYANRGSIHISGLTTTLQCNVLTASQGLFATLTYPVADDWVES